MRKITFLLGFLGIMHSATILGQSNVDEPLTQQERKAVIDSIGTRLLAAYIFPEVAEKINQYLQDRYVIGAYDTIVDPGDFAQFLTSEIRTVNQDRHLSVRYAPDRIKELQNAVTPADSMQLVERDRRYSRLMNYGFEQVKILEGNVGYLKLNSFHGVDSEAGEVATAAMNFLGHTDALIIDLRNNGGGSPGMIQLLSSYLFGDEPEHLNSFYFRPADETTQTWTLPFVPGFRRPDRMVYVLTSGYTFSAAEEFTYNLKHMQRATVVGETTGGGAHPGGTEIATDRFMVWIPSGRAINPVTGTNWEGTGVEPHLKVPANEALLTAQIDALQKLRLDADDEERPALQWTLEDLKSRQQPLQPDVKTLKAGVGKYGPRTITFEDGLLWYQREGNPRYRLIPMQEDLFRIEELSFFRIKLIRDGNQIVALEGQYADGRTDQSPRTEN